MLRFAFAGFLVALIFITTADAQGKKVKKNPNPEIGWQAAGKNGAVCAGGSEAVVAGVATLQKGGNAVDGAVATILALTVTDSKSVCFGGEVPIMVYDAKRNVTELLCGLGAAPKLATREYFANQRGIPKKG